MTTQEMNETASREGFELDFQFFGTSYKEVEDVDSAGNYKKDVVYFTEYQGFGDGLDFGIFARISDDPQLSPNEFSVVYASDGADTNGIAYDSLENALRYLETLAEQQS